MPIVIVRSDIVVRQWQVRTGERHRPDRPLGLDLDVRVNF